MLNKILILFIIILNNFIFSNSFSNDQLNFDVTEIEILDEGNIIKGKKRGTITTNNGIIINADEFEYDKINNILSANGNIKIEDTLNNYNILSENVTYFKNQTLYEISKFSYSIKDEILKGEKIFINTKFNQPFSDKYFFKSAIFDLKDQSYIAQDINIDLKKDIFGNKENDPRFKGVSSSSKNGITTIDKGVFTSC